MRKRLSIAAVGAALLTVVPLGLGGGGSAQALSIHCAADPPADIGCDVVFGVIGLVCNGTVPTLPNLPIEIVSAAVGWPVECPPLG